VYRSNDNRCHYSSPIYYCSPFYSCSNGHKLQLSTKIKCHCGDCSDEYYCKSSHKDTLSLSIDVHVVEGEYDSQLKWPFNRTIRVTLLNEESNKSHHTINEKCCYRDPTDLCPAVPHGEVSQQPEEHMHPWSALLFDSYPHSHHAKMQQDLRKHRDFMIFPLEIKGNFLLHQPESSVCQGNYIGEHQNYFYIQVKL